MVKTFTAKNRNMLNAGVIQFAGAQDQRGNEWQYGTKLG